MCETTSGSATATEYINNDRARVTEWRFKARGDDTGWHTHDYDYIVVPMFDGMLEVEADGTRVQAEMKTGIPYFREAGVTHNVISANDFECVFVEIELLQAPE